MVIMERKHLIKQIDYLFNVNPAIAILGPRQCGKTTLARQYIAHLKTGIPKQNYFDLENSRDIERLKDPILMLSQLSGLIVIDEVQYAPELFSILRVLIDDPTLCQRFLILGSASGQLLRQSSETLAGRISYLELTPFSYPEALDIEKVWIRGGFPKSYLAKTDAISQSWRRAFVKTFLELDIPKLGIQIPPENLRRFWMMLAHRHGQLLNASDIGNSLGLSHKTILNYTDILTSTYMIRQLKPWFENISKRQVKTPKLLFRDSGMFHSLINVTSLADLQMHPQLGNSWECFAIEEIIRFHQADSEDCYFWATHQGAELDFLLVKNNRRIGFEIKYSSSPSLTKSLQIAQQDLKLDKCFVIYPGEVDFPLSKTIQVVGLKSYLASSCEKF